MKLAGLKIASLRIALAIALLANARCASGSPMQAADPAAAGGESHVLTVMPQRSFSVDEGLRKNVEFWIQVNTRYTVRQGIIHDAKYIDHIYEVLDLGNSDRANSRAIRQAKRKWKKALLSLHRKQREPGFPANLDPTEKKAYDLFSDVNEPDKYLRAANHKRLRWQLGQRERFLEGLKESGRYLPAMERIFAREGLPIELTRLPFVESSFNVRARSKVGASGIWQFMRSTGRLFIRINRSVDERNDPIRATEAAAKLLKLNYQSLHSWPLAVTAYNHGRKGMMRAVLKVGSDALEDLISSYHSRSFGFASSNFFAELLAAIEIEKNYKKYFGDIQREAPEDCIEVKLPDPIRLDALTRFLKLDSGAIRELNPALLSPVLKSRRPIPRGYVLRLPYDPKGPSKEAASRIFFAGYEQIPDLYKSKGRFGSRYGRRIPITQE